MPALLDTHALIDLEDVETYDLPIDRPRTRSARPRFWRALAHRITTSLASRRRKRDVSVCPAHRPYDAPMDRFIRENPSLSLHALAVF